MNKGNRDHWLLHEKWWSQIEWPRELPSVSEETYINLVRAHPSEREFEACLLPLEDLVIFPRMAIPVYIEQERSLAAIELADKDDLPLIAVSQRDPEMAEPGPEDLYTVGTEIYTGRILRLPDCTISAMCQGLQRVQIVEYLELEPCIRVRAVPIEETLERTALTEALMRAVLALFEKVVELSRSLPEEAYVYAMNVDDPGWLADLMAQALNLDIAERQEILEITDVVARLQRISVMLAKELDVLELESEIHTQVQAELDRVQREYFLREQMRIIQSELGETDIYTQELEDLRKRIEAKKFPEEAENQAQKELERLTKMPAMSPEVGVIRTYLDWMLDLPWQRTSEDKLDVKHVEQVLESRHYGLPKAKQRILEYIAVRRLAAEKMRSPILCFVGPPGTGKTSLGQSIADALGREFIRISLGGVRDEAEIRGHRRTYVGALPGRIIQGMRRAETINPVFMLDEIDKLGQDFRGDPSSALLEVLDPDQNHAYSDHYLEVPYDLSKVLFVTTANVLDPIPPALEDRMEVIRFPGYIDTEKKEIARRFLIPRQLEEHGLVDVPLTFTDGALQKLIREYTYEAGVRELERNIAAVCRKVARKVAEEASPPKRIQANTLVRFLGPPKYTSTLAETEDGVGIAMGVAWTEAGGDLSPVEVALVPGKGELSLTGQLGDVLQESAQAALTYARARVDDLGIDTDTFEKFDIHIHMPEGAIPKDGPSAGITIATALISALTEIPVRHDVGMTGEITLRGRVLPISGLKAKLLAAYRAGLKRVIIPRRSKHLLSELPKEIERGLDIVLVDRMEQVLEASLVDPET